MATLTFGLIIIVYLGYKVLSLAKKIGEDDLWNMY